MNDKIVNIFLVTDQQNLVSLRVTLLMLMAHANEVNDYHIYILFNEIDEFNKGDINLVIQKHQNFKVTFYQVSERDFATNLPADTPHKSKVARFKYIIGNFDLKKVIYIDTDILLRGDIAQLFKIDLGENILGAIPDVNNRLYNTTLKLPRNFNYFNSGVLLIDCEKWKKADITNQLMETSVKREKDISFVDQDTFNIVFAIFGYKKLDLSWNFPAASQYFRYNLLTYIKRFYKAFGIFEIQSAFKNPRFVHFIGKPKPIDGNLETAFSNEYLQYLENQNK